MTLAPLAPRVLSTWVADWSTTRQLCQPGSGRLVRQGKAQRSAKLVCRSCPVVARCLADALDSRTDFGVWGGMTQRERRALLQSPGRRVLGRPARCGEGRQGAGRLLTPTRRHPNLPPQLLRDAEVCFGTGYYRVTTQLLRDAEVCFGTGYYRVTTQLLRDAEAW